MAATGKDTPTPKPGPRSYTHALIQALKKFLTNKQLPFNPYDLNQEIIRHRSWDTSSQVFNRRSDPSSRHIRIAPISKTAPNTELSRPELKTASYLDLRISFVGHSSFSPEDITKLANEMSTLPRSVGMNISEIEWVAFKPAKDSLQFKQIVRAYLMLWAFIIRWKAKRLPKKRPAEEEPVDGVREPKRLLTSSSIQRRAADNFTKSPVALPLTPEASVEESFLYDGEVSCPRLE